MHLAPLIQDLALILAVAAIIAFVFQRLRLPIVLGYLVAGLLVGPAFSFFKPVVDFPGIQTWADLGVIFLMFTLGLDFSFRRLAALGSGPILTGVFETFCLIGAGFGLGQAFGWNATQSLFLGGTIAISSTTIILKAFESLNLARRKFAENVVALLIVEDLLAILILVALSSLIRQGDINGMDLLMLVPRLFVVIGAWMLVGIFVVPRFLKIVARSGNDELLTVFSLGLCLALVAAAASFGYSAALGAFIMGSIIAETREAQRIQTLVRPLRDVFAAVFFVSIGMLADPRAIASHAPQVAAITALVIGGKFIFVSAGAVLTGKAPRHAMRTAMSMVQIGEFSFIIAGLGQNLMPKGFYATIVATSLLTTFATPFMVRISDRASRYFEGLLPQEARESFDRYATGLREIGAWRLRYGRILKRGSIWLANGVLTTAVFNFAGDHFLPLLAGHLQSTALAIRLTWLATILVTLPFLWAMAMAFRGLTETGTEVTTKAASPPPTSGAASKSEAAQVDAPAGGAAPLILLISRLLAVLWVGALSLQFLSPLAAIVITGGGVTLAIYVFYSHLERSYHWFEERFMSALNENNAATKAEAMERLAPWEAHLVQLNVHPDSDAAGRTLIEAQLRERFGLNVVAIQRGSRVIVAPPRDERIFPDDELLVLGEDEQIERARAMVEGYGVTPTRSHDLSDFELKPLSITEGSPLLGRTILDSKLRENFGALVVGIERQGQRLINPTSHFRLEAGDRLWIVGDRGRLGEI